MHNLESPEFGQVQTEINLVKQHARKGEMHMKLIHKRTNGDGGSKIAKQKHINTE